jgi:protein TonB
MTPSGPGRADIAAPRRARLGAVVLVALLHVAAVLALVRAFAPDFTDRVTQSVVSTFTVTVTIPPLPLPPPPEKTPEPAGAAAPAGARAVAKPAAAPAPKIVLAARPAPTVAGVGNDTRLGARDVGEGTGAGGSGNGVGSGAGGSGQGGGAVVKAVKIAGDINSARDYPKAGREQRRGDHVIVALSVSADGRVVACRVHRPSRDPQADQITCRLATERFRFRPATDSAGNAVPSTFGWQQRWYDPRGDE